MVATGRMYLIVLPFVFLAALVDSISGGGGLISLPAYTMAGLNYDYASGNNKFSSTFGTLVATIRYYRSGRIRIRPALCAIAGSLPCSYLGTMAAIRLGDGFMRVFMLIAAPAAGVIVALKRPGNGKAREQTRRDYVLCALIGAATGFYDGFFGPATGTFLILLFTCLTGMDMVTASATAKPVNLASNVSALITRIAGGYVCYSLAIPAVICSMAGNWIGSRLAMKRGARLVRYVMLAVLGIITVKIAVELILGK